MECIDCDEVFDDVDITWTEVGPMCEECIAIELDAISEVLSEAF